MYFPIHRVTQTLIPLVGYYTKQQLHLIIRKPHELSLTDSSFSKVYLNFFSDFSNRVNFCFA